MTKKKRAPSFDDRLLEGEFTNLDLSTRALGAMLRQHELTALDRMGKAGRLAWPTELNLDGQQLGHKVLPILRHTTNLQHLRLAHNDLDNSLIDALAKALARLRALRGISLAGNHIGAEGVCQLLRTLAKQHGLERLDLSYMNLGADGLAVILKEYVSTKADSLTSLQLDENDLGDSGMRLIAACKPLQRLERLILRSNRIGLPGACALADGLWNHLKDLILSENPVKDEGLVALCKNSSTFSSLQVLEVDHCGLTDASIAHLLAAMTTDPWIDTMRHLWIAENDFIDAPPELISFGYAHQWLEYAMYNMPQSCRPATTAMAMESLVGQELVQSDSTSEAGRPLSLEAEKLLDTLIEYWREAKADRMPQKAWQAKSEWFTRSRLEYGRHRKDAQDLIAELQQAGMIEVRRSAKKRLTYRASKLALDRLRQQS